MAKRLFDQRPFANPTSYSGAIGAALGKAEQDLAAQAGQAV